MHFAARSNTGLSVVAVWSVLGKIKTTTFSSISLQNIPHTFTYPGFFYGMAIDVVDILQFQRRQGPCTTLSED